MANPRVHIIAIGGLEPTGAAGLVRDFSAAQALGAGAELVLTAVTDARASPGAPGYEARPVALVAAALRAALAAAPAGRCAVKIGMTVSPEHVAAIADGLRDFAGPIVFDPVLGSSVGFGLFSPSRDGLRADLDPLLRRATLVMPNAIEAAAILGTAPIQDVPAAEDAARALCAGGTRAVLVKGGHLTGDPIDVLADSSTIVQLPGARWPGPSPRGTGCALAVATAFHLARHRSLHDACAHAKQWLAEQSLAAAET